MGAGGSYDAAFTLEAKVPAGTYHLVLDAIIIKSVDVTFDLIWRSGGTDTQLVEWKAHYDPLGGGNYMAQPFEYDEPCSVMIAPAKGDQLVFRYTGTSSTIMDAYIPNGDGANAQGRIPNITLPK